MKKKRIISIAAACLPVLVQAGSGLWWDDFPRMIGDTTTNALNIVSNYHGNITGTKKGEDPGWGTYWQRVGIEQNAAKAAAFQNAGIKQIGYFETYGDSFCPIIEIGPWNETNLTQMLHQHWNWKSYGGGTIRWAGAKNFFDDEDFARPYTRTHPRYGGSPMTYPDGTVATGYNGPDTDPRNSRVYDAGCSKDVLGNLTIDGYGYVTNGPTDGLLPIVTGTGTNITTNYSGLVCFGKDSACPAWTDYTYASTLQAADAGINGMWTDNYGPWDSFGNPPVKKAFGDWSVIRFRSYLTNTFSAAELTGLGVTHAAAFDIRTYLKTVATTRWGWDGTNLSSSIWRKVDWCDDPLWRAYEIFKRQAGTEALSNYYAAVKSAALAAGNSAFLVAGNDIPDFQFGWTRGDLDMVSTEFALGWRQSAGTKGFQLPPVGRSTPFYKLAREHAQSRFVNVWLYNDSYSNEFTNAALSRTLYYEMLATHTLPKFQPSNTRIAGDESVNAPFFEFVEQATARYGARVPVEDVGVYFSSSSLLRRFTPGGFPNMDVQPHQFAVWGWGTALAELHYQYRMVPEWKLTPEILSTLKVLVIPNADVFDPADVAVLTPWVNSGGRLVVTGDSGKYLGETGNFALNTNGWSVAALTNLPGVVYLSANIGNDFFLAYTNRPALLPQFAQTMDSVLSGTPTEVISTTATATTGITLYQDEKAGKLFIDINNMNLNTNSWQITSTGPLSVEVKLPAWMQGAILQASVVSPQSVAPSVGLTVTASNTLALSVGSVDEYAGVIVENEWGFWREAHFTAEEIKTGIADENQDPDADGYTNWQEYVAGTEPKDQQSVLRLQGGVAAGSPKLSFGTVSGRWYSVYSRTSLVNGAWSLLENNLYGTGESMVVADTNGFPAVFYKLKTEIK